MHNPTEELCVIKYCTPCIPRWRAAYLEQHLPLHRRGELKKLPKGTELPADGLCKGTGGYGRAGRGSVLALAGRTSLEQPDPIPAPGLRPARVVLALGHVPEPRTGSNTQGWDSVVSMAFLTALCIFWLSNCGAQEDTAFD